MGGLFSSQENVPQPRPSHSYSAYNSTHINARPPNYNYGASSNIDQVYPSARQRPESFRHSYQREMNAINNMFDSIHINDARQTTRVSRKISPPECSIKNEDLFGIFDGIRTFVVTYTLLSQYDTEYIQINKLITNKRNFKVDRITKVENPFLEKAYELKKAQKQREYGYVEERLLFHGTKHAYLDSILKENFDWRLCKAHKFGKGVSFSPKATYAANYSDKNVFDKVMIVAKVLIARSCIGNEFMELPIKGCDTSQKGEEGIVIVKYEDNEFYPAYIINYHLVNENIGKKGRYQNKGKATYQQEIVFDDDYLY